VQEEVTSQPSQAGALSGGKPAAELGWVPVGVAAPSYGLVSNMLAGRRYCSDRTGVSGVCSR